MGVPSYVINFDELVDEISAYLQDGIHVNVGDVVLDTSQLQLLLEQINDKIPKPLNLDNLLAILENLNITIQDLSVKLGINGKQKYYGKVLEIPMEEGEYEIIFESSDKYLITDITYSLSSWNYQDNWSLFVGDNEIFSTIYTKEYGENKHFEVYQKVKENEDIRFVFYNNSGSSKILWVDLGVLEEVSDDVFIEDDNTNDNDIITEKNYRLLAIGESNYTLEGASNLSGCGYDAENISNLFKQHKENDKFKQNIIGKNKTKLEVLNLIQSTFESAKDNDINYLFWSGHGTVYQDKFALLATDNIITIDELENILDSIKGTKIIFIDTCHSGLIINKDFALELAIVENKLRNSDKTLNKQNYKILTASSGTELSKDLSSGYDGNINPSGAFTWALLQSIKTKNADKDGNKVVTLEELYQTVLHYWDEFNKINPSATIVQKAQVYPENDATPIFEYVENL